MGKLYERDDIYDLLESESRDQITQKHYETVFSGKEIQVVLADREECKRILKEENVAIMCAYMLMHFIASEGDPLAFLNA